MKKILYVLIAVSLFTFNAYGNGNPSSGVSGQDSLVLVTTPDLKDLVMKWSEGYKKTSPGMATGFRISASLPSEMKSGEIGFFNDRDLAAGNTGSELRMIVARTVIVPVINASNPYLEEIRSKGISPEKMKMLVENPEVTWGELLGDGQDKNVKLHFINADNVVDAILRYTGTDKSRMDGSGHNDAAEMLAAVSGDIYASGFCRLADIRADESVLSKIAILPVDKNGNGTMDSNEDIYNDINAFTRGIWVGKYPKTLFSNILSLTSSPVQENASAFLNWIITDGQNLLATTEFTGLILTERISDASRLYEARDIAVAETGNDNIFLTLLLVAAIVLAIIFITGVLIRSKKAAIDVSSIPASGPILDEKALNLPKGVYFDKTHTWAFMEQDGTVKVGVDDFLLHMTGEVSKVKMKKAGEKVKRGEEILSVIRNGKQLNLYSPVTGVIRELNSVLEYDISHLNTSPYNSWLGIPCGT